MHTTKKLYSKTLVSLALLGLTSVAFANDPSTGNLVNSSQSESMRVLLKEPGGLGYAERNTYQKTTSGNDGDNSTGFETVIPNGQNHDKHLKEHGGQIYQVTKFENQWTVDEDGNGALGSKVETLIGTDENRLFLKANLDKSESNDPKYDVSALYSRYVAPFWDLQAGVRYSEDRNNNSNRVDGVVGILGLAPYFFETQAYLYGGENNFWGASFDVDRDLLLTQKLITQPYIEADIVLNDNSDFASKTGLSELKTGIKTRYEITKRIRPFVDVAYQYEKGLKETRFQQATDSEKGWLYGAGIEFVF